MCPLWKTPDASHTTPVTSIRQVPEEKSQNAVHASVLQVHVHRVACAATGANASWRARNANLPNVNTPSSWRIIIAALLLVRVRLSDAVRIVARNVSAACAACSFMPELGDDRGAGGSESGVLEVTGESGPSPMDMDAAIIPRVAWPRSKTWETRAPTDTPVQWHRASRTYMTALCSPGHPVLHHPASSAARRSAAAAGPPQLCASELEALPAR